MVNPNYLTYFPDAELPIDKGHDERSSCLRVGSFLVIEKLMIESLVDKIIASIYNDDRGSGLFLDLAAYYIVTENNAGQYYPDYAYNHPLFLGNRSLRVYTGDALVGKMLIPLKVRMNNARVLENTD